MSAFRSFFCVLAATSVVLNLNLAPSCLGSRAGTAGETAAGGCQGPKRCCCGTTDGRCCGMACCRMPASQDKSPGLPKRPDNREKPVAPTITATGKVPAPEAAWFQSGLFADAPRAGSPSLIALSIRLNV